MKLNVDLENFFYPNYIERVNKFGIINSISYRISFDRENNKIIANIDNVKNAIELLKEVQIYKKRISEMLPFQTVGKHCRDTFFILLYI